MEKENKGERKECSEWPEQQPPLIIIITITTIIATVIPPRPGEWRVGRVTT